MPASLDHCRARMRRLPSPVQHAIGRQIGYSSGQLTPHRRTRMPRTKAFAVTGTAELNAMIERVTPDVLRLLADGVPRKRAATAGARPPPPARGPPPRGRSPAGTKPRT